MRSGSAEERRLREADTGAAPWRKWGPYLAEREWGTVREDYSKDGNFWEYFSHEVSRSRAYRWCEDGIGGFSDDRQTLCVSLAFWNGRDTILKERFFGLANPEGNHGEDVKEIYYYLDGTPTHSYMRMLYKYPQAAFPYAELVEENGRRSMAQPEYELQDTGVFADDAYFDIFIEYAKAGPEDILLTVTVHNRADHGAMIHVLPQVWFRNTWGWECEPIIPTIRGADPGHLVAEHGNFGTMHVYADDQPEALFTHNDSHQTRAFHREPAIPSCYKDGFHDFVIHGDRNAILAEPAGTKAAFHYIAPLRARARRQFRVRLRREAMDEPFREHRRVTMLRQREADRFYDALSPALPDPEQSAIRRQALAGLLWNKQFYHFDVAQWLSGDPNQPPPPKEHSFIRNTGWTHFKAADILSMPDSWEFPWFAAWDLAFQCTTLSLIDPHFAKEQLLTFVSDRYMSPAGELPAYEMALGDLNPPLHAWAVRSVYAREVRQGRPPDYEFLERCFHKLMLNFAWWNNNQRVEPLHLFSGGFLGLDNIGIIDRGAPLEAGRRFLQVDGTSWMAKFALDLMQIALELAKERSTYEELACTFLDQFLLIARDLNGTGPAQPGLWDNQDHFYYDAILRRSGKRIPLRSRSLVGLTPLFATAPVSPETLEAFPRFAERLRTHLSADYVQGGTNGNERILLTAAPPERMKILLRAVMDPNEFLSPYGVRSLSKLHETMPAHLQYDDEDFTLGYEPGVGTTDIFGGNSNWRGPVWLPANMLLLESLDTLSGFDGLLGELTRPIDLRRNIIGRVLNLFRARSDSLPPLFGSNGEPWNTAHFRGKLLFYEYFNAETGAGCGAAHQSGWTSLVANLIGDTDA